MDKEFHVDEKCIPLIAPSWTTFTSLNNCMQGYGRNRFPITTLPHHGGTGFLIIPKNDEKDEQDDEGSIEDDYSVFYPKKYFTDSKLLFNPKW